MQFARPISTIAAGQWTASAGALFECLDETSPSDTDFISHAWVAADNSAELGLTSSILPNAGTHTLRVRARMRNPGPYVGVTQLTLTLKSAGMPVASETWGTNGIGTTWTTLTRVLTAPEIASITDYSALSVELTREGFLVIAGETMDVSWFEYEMPPGSMPPPGSGDDRKYYGDGGTRFYPKFAPPLSTNNVASSGAPGFGNPADFAPWSGATFVPGKE